MKKSWQVGILVGWIFSLAGCGGSDSYTRMLHVEPPLDYTQRVEQERHDRDGNYRSAPWSPIPEASRESFTGLEYFPIDHRFYFIGPVVRYAEPEKLPMVTTGGQNREAERIGWLEFELDGHSLQLQVYHMLDGASDDDEGLFLPFTDGTTGAATYPAGRYINLRGPEGGPYILDFNRAFNPYCAYGEPERYACPLAPEENRLPIVVEAGERGYADHDDAT